MNRNELSALAQSIDQTTLLDWISVAPAEVLANIHRQIANDNQVIQITGNLKLTKSRQDPTHVYLLRDHDLERSVRQWLNERQSLAGIIERYRNYDPALVEHEWPQHYAVRMLAGLGSVCAGTNIFMFFPEVLGVSATSSNECFGFEFVDVWSNIFQKVVFPCWRATFDLSSQIKVLPSLSCNLDRTIYLAAVFHEVGHRVGPIKISPAKHPWLKLSAFYLDVLGELSTDTLLTLHLAEFPEVAHFVFAQRLFWFGRRGFASNPVSGLINEDNDAWISALLWNRAVRAGVIEPSGNVSAFHSDLIGNLFTQLRNDVDQIGRELRELETTDAQDACVRSWMSNQVEEVDGKFSFSPEQRRAFYGCQEIAEVPHFAPLINLSKKDAK